MQFNPEPAGLREHASRLFDCWITSIGLTPHIKYWKYRNVPNLLDYLGKLDKLHRSPNVPSHVPFPMGKQSPYKPTLLLVIFEGIHQGIPEFSSGEFTLEDCKAGLRAIYTALNQYDQIEPTRFDAMSAQPFWYLGVGKPKLLRFNPRKGKASELKEAATTPVKQIKTSNALSKLVHSASIPPADLNLLKQDVANLAIRGFLVSRYFPQWETHVHTGLNQLQSYWNKQ